MSHIILNHWTGDGYENDTRCNVCGNLASVIKLPFKLLNNGRTYICSACLDQAQQELGRAVLAAASGVRAYTPGDQEDDGEVD